MFFFFFFWQDSKVYAYIETDEPFLRNVWTKNVTKRPGLNFLSNIKNQTNLLFWKALFVKCFLKIIKRWHSYILSVLHMVLHVSEFLGSLRRMLAPVL